MRIFNHRFVELFLFPVKNPTYVRLTFSLSTLVSTCDPRNPQLRGSSKGRFNMPMLNMTICITKGSLDTSVDPDFPFSLLFSLLHVRFHILAIKTPHEGEKIVSEEEAPDTAKELSAQ